MKAGDGSWHEPLDGGDDPVAGSSDRAFGLLFAAVTGVLALLALWKGRSSAYGWAIVAVLFIAAALFAPSLLGPLNRTWRRFGLLLSKLTTPFVMGLLFFVVLTPLGFAMRLSGKDPLRLHFEPQSLSYWLARQEQGERPTAMTRQF
ncbi:MAG: SxtJ family membrane protein [Stellaceae bacterium]